MRMCRGRGSVRRQGTTPPTPRRTPRRATGRLLAAFFKRVSSHRICTAKSAPQRVVERCKLVRVRPVSGSERGTRRVPWSSLPDPKRATLRRVHSQTTTTKDQHGPLPCHAARATGRTDLGRTTGDPASARSRSVGETRWQSQAEGEVPQKIPPKVTNLRSVKDALWGIPLQRTQLGAQYKCRPQRCLSSSSR